MANRSYLYSYYPDQTPLYRDLSEWRSDIPLSHLLLIGFETEIRASLIWDADGIALTGKANEGRDLLLKFIDWLSPQINSSSFEEAVANTKDYLLRPTHQGTHFHLEPGEIYDLQALDLDGMVKYTKYNAALANEIFLEISQVISTPDTTCDALKHFMLKNLKTDWENTLGLHFTYVLYWHLGSGK
jgi:hypothetical protein